MTSHTTAAPEPPRARSGGRDGCAAASPSRAPRDRLARYLVAALTAAPLLAVALPGAALAHGLHRQQSSNWAGYAVTAARPFESVSGGWVQPAAHCAQQGSTYAAFWVGLGGFKQNSQKLEQIGTESDCTAAGRATSYAWYELVPHPPVKIRLGVRPGDRITAQVTVDGGLVLLRIQNLADHRTIARTIRFSAPDTSSAEWIAEAPSACADGRCQPLPLTDFGTIGFTGATAATAGGRVGTITNSAFTTIELTLSAGAPVAGPEPTSFAPYAGDATPARPSHDGADFTVSFEHRASTLPPPPSPQAAPDQLRHERSSWLASYQHPVLRCVTPARCDRGQSSLNIWLTRCARQAAAAGRRAPTWWSTQTRSGSPATTA